MPTITNDLYKLRYEIDSDIEPYQTFLDYWDKKITKSYDFVKYLYIYNGLMKVEFKWHLRLDFSSLFCYYILKEE